MEARFTLKNIPPLGGFKDTNSWETRTIKWEFKNECDYEIAFKEQFFSIVHTKYPRLQVNVEVKGQIDFCSKYCFWCNRLYFEETCILLYDNRIDGLFNK